MYCFVVGMKWVQVWIAHSAVVWHIVQKVLSMRPQLSPWPPPLSPSWWMYHGPETPCQPCGLRQLIWQHTQGPFLWEQTRSKQAQMLHCIFQWVLQLAWGPEFSNLTRSFSPCRQNYVESQILIRKFERRVGANSWSLMIACSRLGRVLNVELSIMHKTGQPSVIRLR